MTATTFDRRTINLRALNSLTKYPSIPTYHQLDPRNGSLTDEHIPFTGEVIGTEKVDGTNSRIILLPDGGYMLGSREELLHANGDLIHNPALGIVEHLQPVVGQLNPLGTAVNAAVVFYLELYGGKIGGQAKQYSARGAVGWRLFDVAYIDHLDERLTWPAERISGWRDNGGQKFATEDELREESQSNGLDLTPRLFNADGNTLPHSIEDMHAYLRSCLPGTCVSLDDSAKGEAEGIVLRTPDRSVIAKARFQDYERTLKRRASGR
ncbi:hypothetical protein GCM10010172_80060 [Paractinoplanes ferrugineus]|uniref:RNA ligase domain-containing protein n=1 Tax=Paractinoplanes ferrugineus TaxID=113564 RepID=A0A919JBC2_9ACTN|nr:RNA ligase family protein [Actinoplanes ferrugineus]GIE16722.1 hypothetical protein Afe05nite_85620 [Actinoplanes ferrugineus]